MKEFENLNRHLRAIKQYLIYRTNLYDTVKQRSDSRKQEIIIHYDREVRTITRYIDDLAIIFQKNINKFQIK